MEYNFRTLNYLGSKLRLLDFIEENIRKVTPNGATICDLFAGSGCVSYKLSADFPIIACDIQHYSRVINSALLLSNTLTEKTAKQFISEIETDNTAVLEAFAPLINIENEAITNKDLEVLSNIVEHGSLEVSHLEKTESLLYPFQKIVYNNLERTGHIEKESLISRYYGGVYFSYKQAVDIDTILSAIRNYPKESDRLVLMAALLSTVSDIVCTVGKHFAQPIKARDSKGNIKNIVYSKAIKDKTIDVIPLFDNWLSKYIHLHKCSKVNDVLQGDYMECLSKLPDDVKTVYADPPYTRDHYSRFYHVLETIALDDVPEISKVKCNGTFRISNGIYRKDRHQSPFCIRSKALMAFEDMFKFVSKTNRNLLLSYSPYDEFKQSHPRVVTIKQLISLAEKYFTTVDIVSAGYFTHNKLNSTEHFLASSEAAELLIVCSN